MAALTPGERRELLRAQVRRGRENVPLGRHSADLLPGLPVGRFLWRFDHPTDAVLARVVEMGARACRREHVPQSVWDGAADLLPHARPLAGTFPAAWTTGPAPCWCGADDLVQHAAVTLGGGWALHRPAQTWWTPRVVRPVRDVKAASRTPGWRLSPCTARAPCGEAA